jgi:phosphoglycerate kinase
MKETLAYGRSRGWKQVVFGHIGRKPDATLRSVSRRLGQIMGCPVTLISDWLDESTLTIGDQAAAAVRASADGSLLMLENTRRYKIERVLWGAKPDDLPQLAPQLARLANQFAEKLGEVYVNEALSAGNLDTSSTIVPAAMRRAVLGAYVGREFSGPMIRCLQASFVVFSGLKIDKLDDLSAVVQRGAARFVVVGGSLAMALKKAEAELNGKTFCLGLAEDAAHSEQPYYIPAARVQQAKEILTAGRAKGIQFYLPVDFVLNDGRVSDAIGPQDQQFDIGPQSSEHFARAVGEFIAATQGDRNLPKVLFHNGVMGKFEETLYEGGTRRFMEQLKRARDAGIEVYIGGGEGGEALKKFGQPDWVSHCFTAGGTVLNALGSEPVPYLLALRMKLGPGDTVVLT